MQTQHIKLVQKCYKLKTDTDQLLRRQIGLREQMDMTRAATDGLIAAREWILNKSEVATKNPHKGSIWLADSFASYFHQEMERINNLNFNPEIISFANNLKRKRKPSRKPSRKIIIKKRAKPAVHKQTFVFTAGESKNKTVHDTSDDEPEEDTASVSGAAAEPSENIAEAIAVAITEAI